MKRALRACLIAGMTTLGLASHADEQRSAEPGALADKSIEALQQIIVDRLANRELPYTHGVARIWTSGPVNAGEACSNVWKSRQINVSFPSTCVLRKDMRTKLFAVWPTVEHEQSTPDNQSFRCDVGGVEQLKRELRVEDTFDLRNAWDVKPSVYGVGWLGDKPRWAWIMEEMHDKLLIEIAMNDIVIPPQPGALETTPALEIFCSDEERCYDTTVNDDPLQPKKSTLRIAVPDTESSTDQPLLKVFRELLSKCGNDEEAGHKEK